LAGCDDNCNIRFQFIETPVIDSGEKSANGIISFNGSIREVVRTKDFNPFDKENFMTFTLFTMEFRYAILRQNG